MSFCQHAILKKFSYILAKEDSSTVTNHAYYCKDCDSVVMQVFAVSNDINEEFLSNNKFMLDTARKKFK